MTEPELRTILTEAIDALLIGAEDLDDAAGAASLLMACLAAQRNGRLADLARAAWVHLDEAPCPGACRGPGESADRDADDDWDRFARVWSRAAASADPSAQRFSDLWYRAFLTRYESQEAVQRVKASVEASRRTRARRPL